MGSSASVNFREGISPSGNSFSRAAGMASA